MSGFNLSFVFLLTAFAWTLQGCEAGPANRIEGSPVAAWALLPLEDYPNPKAAGWNRDGMDHLKREHWRKAAADFGRALEQDADFAEAHFNRALAFQAQGKETEAATHFRLALQKAGNDLRIGESPALPEGLRQAFKK